MTLETPEKFRFRKSAQLTETEKRTIQQWLANQTIAHETITPKNVESFERAAKIDYLICSGVDWAKETLGIDLKLRLPDLQKIRFIAEQDIPEEERDPSVPAIHEARTGEILVVEYPDENKNMRNLSHEIVHTLSATRIDVKREEGKLDVGEVTHSGFRGFKHETFKYFNELVTEAINLSILDYHQHQSNGADYLEQGHEIAYANGVLFFDTLVRAVAERLGQKEYGIRNEIFRGYFKGDLTVLKRFTEAFGSTGGEPILRTLAGLKDQQYPPELLHMLLFALKIEPNISLSESKYMRRWRDYSEGKPVEIMGGIQVHKRQEK